MNKEDFKQYLIEAVDAMDSQNLDNLFPVNNQPDLMTLLEGLIGLRGEVKKMAQSSLLLQNDVKQLVQSIKQETIENKPQNIPKNKTDNKDTQNLKYILRELIKMEAVISKTTEHLKLLSDPKVFNLNDFKKNFSAWKEGYILFNKQWKALLKSTGMYKTGMVNSQFDPQFHEAVATKWSEDKKENTILETVQIGYLYKNKLIQEAKVVVNQK